MARHMEDDIFTPQEAADLLGVKLMTLYQWVHRKKIKCYRLGEGRGLLRFRRREVEAHIEKRRAGARATAPRRRKPGAKAVDLDAAVRDALDAKPKRGGES